MEDYEIWRHGMVRAIKRKGTKLDPKAWLKTALPAVPTFPLPDPVKYSTTSTYLVKSHAFATTTSEASKVVSCF